MNVGEISQPARRFPGTVRVAFRHGTRVGHCFSTVVGCTAIFGAVALWAQPAWRAALFEQVVPLLASTIHADLGGPQSAPATLTSSISAAARVVSASAGVPAVPFSAAAANVSERIDQAPAFRMALASLPLSVGAGNVSSAVATAPLNAARAPSVATHAATLRGPAGGANAALFDVFNRQLTPADLPGFVSAGFTTAGDAPVHPARVTLDGPVFDDDATSHPVAAAAQPQQRLVADYLAHRYRVALKPMSKLVQAAYETGHAVGIDPLLLLSVMAIESGFNPYAESGVGAQGLMQVMATVHRDKFEDFGGPQAALQPLANLKVGALVLNEYIRRSGSIAGGLRMYVGSTVPGDGGYGVKVLAERDRLRDVARGRRVPLFGPAQPVVASVNAAKPARVSLTLSSVSHKSHESAQAEEPVAENTEMASDAQPLDVSTAPVAPADADSAAPDGSPRAPHRASASAVGRASAVQAGDSPPAPGNPGSTGSA